MTLFISSVKTYKIVFSKLRARDIYNYVGPWDWRDDQFRIGKRKYLYENKIEWYQSLETDILANGISDPILVVSGLLPPNDLKTVPKWSLHNSLFCSILGGSRLFVAQKYDLEIPCIISDFNGKFNDLSELSSKSEVEFFFKNGIKNYKLTRWGLDLR